MPPPLRIPPRYRSGLRSLARLPDDQVAQLETALAEMPSRLTRSRLAEHVREAMPELADDARDILDAVLSLIGLLPEDAAGDARAEEVAWLADDVSVSPDLELEPDDQPVFAERLRRLLQLEPVVLAARALDLVTEFDRVYHGARIFTDLRPVFGPDARAGAKAAAIVATLKIDAHEGGGELRPYYFALDHADLLELHRVIDRALVKTTELRRLAERLHLPYWEYEEVDDAADP
jgi:hypothetical protein